MEIRFNVTGTRRKELVGSISEVIGMKAVYKFMPTCAFVINNITVEKDGTMVWDERTDQDTIEAVIIALAAAGKAGCNECCRQTCGSQFFEHFHFSQPLSF